MSIEGRIWGTDWSSHVRAWMRSGRPNTLVLRYETLVADPNGALEQIARFAQLTPAPIRLKFDTLHDLEPRFFRVGSNDTNLAELRGEDLERFSARHGEVMRATGYWSSKS